MLCFAKHWAVYHFWSLAHHRYEMAVLELYDATPRDLSIGSMLFGNQNASSSAFLSTSCRGQPSIQQSVDQLR